MAFDESRYYKPNLRAFSPERLERLRQSAGALVGELAVGVTAQLPDGVLGFLDEHAAAISDSTVGPLRVEIARMVLTEDGEPYSQGSFIPSDALNIAELIKNLLLEDQVAEFRLEMAEEEARAIWD